MSFTKPGFQSKFSNLMNTLLPEEIQEIVTPLQFIALLLNVATLQVNKKLDPDWIRSFIVILTQKYVLHCLIRVKNLISWYFIAPLHNVATL
jgi:hypothetical protein